jgi:hypothetical protein
MEINCQVVDNGIMHAVTAKFDITDVKFKSLDFPRTV